MSGSSLPHLGENVGQLLTLPLGSDVSSKSPFQELQCPLILRHLKQFHGPFLIWGMSDYFSDQIPNELGMMGLDPLQPRGTYFVGLGLAGWDFCSFVALLESYGYFVPRCHAM